MSGSIPTYADVMAARSHLISHIRTTPLIPAMPTRTRVLGQPNLWLKLDCLQVTGSFKVRGAVNKLLSMSPEAIKRGIVTASGGNHGLAVAYAGWLAQVPTVIVLGENVPPAKADKLRQWGAEVITAGADWDEANQVALAMSATENLPYIHPFADPLVIAGQGTLALEILETHPEIDTLIVAIGGGGLISGIGLAAKALHPQIRIIGVEPVGAATLSHSLGKGEVTALPHLATRANTLAPRQTEQINFDIIQRCVDEIVLVNDESMAAAARWLWFEFGIAAELAGAATLAALFSHPDLVPPEAVTCALVCGAGTDGVS